jgi:hypothetical protein
MKDKRLLFITLLMTLFMQLQGQNLVPNGSFETLDPAGGCPGPDGFNLGRPQYWTGYYPPASTGTYDLSGDYFFTSSTCNQTTGYNYPGANEAGCQTPLHGQAYCGFLAAATNIAQPVSESEYIMNTNIPLTAGQQYYVEFYISNAAGNSNGFPSSGYSRNIGAFFIQTSQIASLSNGQINGLNNISLTRPQIPNTFPATNYYTTSNGWQKISGYFTPNFTTTWTMVIGNFDPGMNTLVTNSCNSNEQIPNPDLLMKSSFVNCQDAKAAYYFVDAVTVIPSNQTPPVYSASIQGPGLVCSTGVQYSLTPMPFGLTSINWSSSNTNGLAINQTTGNANQVNSFNGTVAVAASYTDVCNVTTAVTPRNVYVGKPAADNSTLIYVSGNRGVNPITLNQAATYYFQCDAVAGASSFNWILPSGFSFLSGNGSQSLFITTSATSGTYSLFCSVSNSCGSSYTHNLNMNVQNGGGGGGGGGIAVVVSTFPNPSSSALIVQVDDSLAMNPQSNLLEQPYQLTIKNRQSATVYSIQSAEKKLRIPVSEFPNDIYYLNLAYKDRILQKQIVINH